MNSDMHVKCLIDNMLSINVGCCSTVTGCAEPFWITLEDAHESPKWTAIKATGQTRSAKEPPDSPSHPSGDIVRL